MPTDTAATAADPPTAASPPESDARLIARSLEDPDAFRDLFDRHWTRVRRYAAARVGDAADDVASETFATAFQCRGRYDLTRADAAPWLLGIATNHVRRLRRAEHKRLRALAAAGAASGPLQLVEPAPPRDGALAHALLQLDRRDRDVLALFALADLSYAEIAAALGIPEGTVRSRLNRARRIVKEVLAS